ncbi:MAG: hypothetical protein Q9227_005134 [Pyrenula ochraceoflavens]
MAIRRGQNRGTIKIQTRPIQVGHKEDVVTIEKKDEMHRCKVMDFKFSDSIWDWEYKLEFMATNQPYESGEWIKQGSDMQLAVPGPNNPRYNRD